MGVWLEQRISRCAIFSLCSASVHIPSEQLLNTHLAYRAQRAYVFPNYIPRDHPPFPDTLPNGTRHMLEVPMNAFVSGPTGGGPLSADHTDSILRRAVSVEWWDIVCPPENVVSVKLYDTLQEMGLDGGSDGKDMMDKWANKLLGMSAPCISIVDGSPFDYIFIGSSRVISIWPDYSNSPVLQYFAWSPLITAAIFRHFHFLSDDAPPKSLAPVGEPPYDFQSFRPYISSAPPIPGLLGIHVRRGDYEGHCINLANGGADYNAWNLIGTPGLTPATKDGYVWPALPDYLDIPGNQSRRDAAFDHCWPSPAAIVTRARKVQVSAASEDALAPQNLRRIYISTNGESSWVTELAAALRADGWKVASSLDLLLTREEKAVGQAVDMGILVAADAFIGVGFSSLTSNVVQIRLGGGRDARTIHFW
ncbi:hypothetical protein C8F04DRAFT_1152421 [Mycena alexandri]|uniref:Uncharacterized protein n=1 Tax=Mycena alexandri TaxID=1745969 RepID=A0AAD6S1I0_9AGAR|nr:hypothetical protein C8F04DRAFT_1152421 [Mycena alexandri]